MAARTQPDTLAEGFALTAAAALVRLELLGSASEPEVTSWFGSRSAYCAWFRAHRDRVVLTFGNEGWELRPKIKQCPS